MIIFDSDRCFRRKEIDYSLLSIDDLNTYANLFYAFLTSGWFGRDRETVLMDLNIIHKNFRIRLNDTSGTADAQWFSIYKNGNLKTAECMFHFLNYAYGMKNKITKWTLIPHEIDKDGAEPGRYVFSSLSPACIDEFLAWNDGKNSLEFYYKQFFNMTSDIGKHYRFMFDYTAANLGEDAEFKIQKW